ncbi:MAG: hypothetical protein AAGD09_26985 [Cyanobacteria bacterium P01_F01_bin.56]
MVGNIELKIVGKARRKYSRSIKARLSRIDIVMPWKEPYGFQLNNADVSWPGKPEQLATGGWSSNQDFVERNVCSQEICQPVLNAEIQMLEELVTAGQLTSVQRTMVIHDQASTGMTITEILIARGWL